MYDDDDDKKIDQDDAAEPVIPEEAVQPEPEKEEDTPDGQEEEMQQPESSDSDGTSQEETREDPQEEDSADGTSSPDTLEHLDALLTQFNESLIRFNESLDRFNTLSQKITADLPQVVDASSKLEQHLQAVEDAVQEEKQLRSDIRQCTHWLENTNKHYTEIMTAMPNQIYTLYLGQAKKYEAKFQKTFHSLDEMIKAEMEGVKPPSKISYPAMAVMAVIQAFFIIYMLR
ncbi:spindle and kinetochore-associated protein 1 [Megasphaera elsdenii]|uniref:spindle and kinetochore-associated protein 1 n=1 Tax=Megasphaera elsdenii TaxID=907 RepID=UPI003D001C48